MDYEFEFIENMKLTKEQALKEIEKLQKYVEEVDELQKKEKECKHAWKPMPDGVVDWVDDSDCWPLRWTTYHWYCEKCQETKTTQSEKNRS